MSTPRIIKSSRSDGLGKLLEANPAVAVGVGFLDHPSELLRRQGVAEFGHGVGQLGGGDEPIAVPVEHPEQLPELVLGVGRLGCKELGRDEGGELRELDEAVVIGVGLVDQDLQLVRARLQAERPQQRAQLQLRQAAVIVPVE